LYVLLDCNAPIVHNVNQLAVGTAVVVELSAAELVRPLQKSEYPVDEL
jgi:hypothetical protein